MWYYSVNNQQVGPVDDEAMKMLIAGGTVTPTTMVWRPGMPNWQVLSSTMLVPGAAPVPQVAPVPSAYPMTPQPGQYNPYMMVKPAAVQIKEMNDMFMWFWICLAGSIITFGASAIASIVLMYIMLYRFWKLIQDGYARTTPGKAIGFMFIPFYNFYWIFQAIPGWAKDANAFIARRNLPIAPIDTTLPTVYCILLLCSAIPYVDFLTGPAALVIMIIMLNRFKNAANQIIQYTQQ